MHYVEKIQRRGSFVVIIICAPRIFSDSIFSRSFTPTHLNKDPLPVKAKDMPSAKMAGGFGKHFQIFDQYTKRIEDFRSMYYWLNSPIVNDVHMTSEGLRYWVIASVTEGTRNQHPLVGMLWLLATKFLKCMYGSAISSLLFYYR